MVERIDLIKYEQAELPSTVEGVESLFLTGPAEFLCAEIAKQLLAADLWKTVFGVNIDSYKRMDYPIRALPAMRIYNNEWKKPDESWFVNGDIIVDVIFPPSIRRKETEQLPDTISAALMQQFRRTSFFNAISDKCPGLNELGRRFSVDKSLAFDWGDDLAPLTQLSINFKMDLRQWDEYMESDNRTVDDPFSRPLGDLRRLASVIQGVKDNAEIEVTIGIDQSLNDDE